MNKYDKVISVIESNLLEFEEKLNFNPLKVSKPYRIYGGNEAQWPNAENPGVYVFLTQKTILYIGKCEVNIGKRIWSHIGRSKKMDEIEEFPDAKKWIKENREEIAVVTIPLEADFFWIAPALESFLIWKIHPQRNKKGYR